VTARRGGRRAPPATVLVTGFEPFGGHPSNPSEEIAKAVDGRVLHGLAVRAAILPVHHAEARREAARLLGEHDPRAVLHVGLAAGRARIALERIALNVMDYTQADNAGYQARGEPCVPGGPVAYLSTLPLAAILDALGREGIPAYLSNTAGTYLCNQTLYTTLHAVAMTRKQTVVGFLHVPLSPALVAASGLDQPSMDPAIGVRAVETALQVVSRECAAA
jgi:pyroglutamyl-peptidase